MGRLRNLRKRVMAAQTKLKDPDYTEFIGLIQNQAAILAEAQRLNQTLFEMGICQRYTVHNRYIPDQPLPGAIFPRQTIVRLPELPTNATPLEQVKGASCLIFSND
jgi:arsenite-transporting ATPase